MVEPSRSERWGSQFKKLSQRGAANVEEWVDVMWGSLARRLNLHEAEHIASYSGYGNAEKIWITGRLLGDAPKGGPQEDDSWFENLQATYQRWESDEITDAKINLSYRGAQQTVVTDSEGYYNASFTRADLTTGPESVVAEHAAEGNKSQAPVTAIHSVYGPAPSSRLLIISDMDDTVIHTGITNLLLAAQLTFLNNAKTRKPLTGVGALYRGLVDGPTGGERNPVFYVSNSAWNMYDLLRDFVALNDIPAGPLLLRDIGLDLPGQGSSNHKIDTVLQILQRFPDMPAILVGDSGQHDADIYGQVVAKMPDRIRAIYIRDIDPNADSAFDANVDKIIRDASGAKIPFLRVRDSSVLAAHARKLGFLNDEQLAAIKLDVSRDKQRDSVAEEVLEELVEPAVDESAGK